MRIKRIITTLLLTSVFSLSLFACKDKKSGKSSEKKTTEKKTTTSSSTTGFDDEKALKNFVDKVEAGNYKITGDDFVVNAYSNNLIWYDYERLGYNDFVVMSDDGETFQAYVKNNKLTKLEFVEYSNASEACSKEALSLKYITNNYGANMFDILYNVQDKDGVYVAYGAPFKDLIQRLGAYSEIVFGSMQEVYLTLDSENPTKATLKTHVYNQTSYYDFDIVLDIDFGGAEENELAAAWLDNPVKPSDPTEWDLNKLGAIDFVFNLYQDEPQGQGVPFPTGATYALYLDPYAAKYQDTITLYDKHMSENDVTEYINNLTKPTSDGGYGYTQATDADGDICYRKVLRNYSDFYSSIYVEYNDGLNLVAIPYYKCYNYTGLSDINTDLAKYDFPELVSDTALTSIKAVDETNMESETYLYISQYDLVLVATLEFDDTDKIDEYLEGYYEALKNAGYAYQASQEDPHYTAYYGDRTVRFRIDYNSNKVLIKFKANCIYTKQKINNYLTQSDRFPQLPFVDSIERFSAKDRDKYDAIVHNKSYFIDFEVDLYFEDYKSLDKFLDNYVDSLIDAGFSRKDDTETGRPYEYYRKTEYEEFICAFSILQSDVSSEMQLVMVFIEP